MEYGKKIFATEYARKLMCIDKEDDESCSSCIKFKTNNLRNIICDIHIK